MKFYSAPNTSIQRCLYSLFQNQCFFFCCPLVFNEYLNLQLRINKTINKHTIDYHPSPLELASNIHPLVFLYLPLQNICWIFSRTYISQHGWGNLSKFMVFRLLENAFGSQKIKTIHFYLCPLDKTLFQFLSLPP